MTIDEIQHEIPAGDHAARVQAFFDRPERYLTRNHAIALRAELVAKLAGDVDGASVLDLGCGDGSLSRQFARRAARITLVDRAPNMLALARSALEGTPGAEVEAVVSDLIDIPDEPYDLVLCIGVLAHVESVPATIAKLATLTKPGGRCIVQLTDRSHPLGRLLYAYHSRRLARTPGGFPINALALSELAELAERHGLHVADARRHFVALPGMGRLPAGFVLGTERFVTARPRLRPLGSEVLVAFDRRHG